MRNWSAEEQTMVDLIELSGFKVDVSTDKDCAVACLFSPKTLYRMFKADTAYEAIRKAFTFWSKRNA
jgi:hypothetical protein